MAVSAVAANMGVGRIFSRLRTRGFFLGEAKNGEICYFPLNAKIDAHGCKYCIPCSLTNLTAQLVESLQNSTS